jgi:hypothetical protein
MIALVTLMICASLLFAQYRHHEHESILKAGHTRLDKLEIRLANMEIKKNDAFNKAEFEELKTKVEALRIASGLRVVR